MKKLLSLLLLSGTLMAHNPQELKQAYIQKGDNYKPRTRHFVNNQAEFTNHLILANSPYLLQHAHNPVNWHAFNDEAFELAKSQNKLIFLSIGYATCHWCHVMEEQSFEDLEVAQILNENYISIKVDREVLPDVDAHFMSGVQLITGSGGWPLNAILTPGGNIFYGGTYFPKDNLISTLEQIQSIWKNDKKQIFNTARNIKNALRAKQAQKINLPKNLQTLATKDLLQGFDEFDGGFGNAPKFPHEAQLLMLIDAQMRTPNQTTLNAITTTLDNMAAGGIYDVLAGGFHRYATDNAWLFPHFEKMLYNQAQLAVVYVKAFELTKNPLYRRIFTQTLDYTIKEMKDKNGGFYSATDADSSGEEGLFFIWTKAQIKTILADGFKTFEQYFDLSNTTEFESGHVIHYKNFNALKQQDFDKVNPLIQTLYNARQKREKPLLDNKILLSWNALLLKTFVQAGEYDKKYLIEAEKLAKFLLDNFYQNDLQRVQIDNKTSQKAIFEDYAYFADALIELFDKTNDNNYLKTAQKLIDTAIENFWDDENHGFNISNNKRIQNNLKEIYDGAIFSPNGVAYSVLNKLSNRLKKPKYQLFSKQLINAFSAKISQNPSAYGSIINAHSAFKQGSINGIAYAYNGKIKITSGNGKINLEIEKGWHINANKVLQKGLIATEISSKGLKTVNYPNAKITQLGFSKDKLAVYEGDIEINYTLKNNDFSIGQLHLQACSDKVCLPPQTISIKL